MRVKTGLAVHGHRSQWDHGATRRLAAEEIHLTHDYDVPDEEAQHGKEAHIHDPASPADSPG